jgi:signal transduction histidine kinase
VEEWLGTSTDIDDQMQARAVLARGSEELEAQVATRTAELQQALATLKAAIAQREQAEERLRQSEKLKAVGQLTGGIAHDLNNMLQSITGSLSMVRLRLQQARAADIPGYVDRAERGAHRAATLTHRLLAFARRQTLAPKPVDLDRVAGGMEDMLRRTIGPGIQLDMRLANGRWLVMCDPDQMESALLNLCINARDAMPDGGWLTVGTQEVMLTDADVADHEDMAPGRYVAIAVSDTGTGMTPEVVQHVFEPFFTTKPQGQGTGLGLSQIYGFVRQSGGLMQIDTAPGQGTTVRVCLPYCGRNEQDTLATGTRTGKTLLLVEDEEDVRELISENLRDLGYSVLEAEDGAAALRLVQAGTQFDLLVSDIGLPGMLDGRQLVDAVRARIPHLPVVLITGYAGGQAVTNADLLHKPFDLSVLADLVRTRIDSGP